VRVLKIIGDIDIGLDLPKDADIVEVTLPEYLDTTYEDRFDLILCVHILQTLWTDEVSAAIIKLVGDLAHLGELHIHVPATEQAVKAMLQGIHDQVAFYMVWGSKDRPFHTGFNLLWLRAIVEQTGAIIRTATMGKFSISAKDEEKVGIEHVVIATVVDP
jgi:hypothetical protein